jgi:hypothetical protein
MDATTVPKSNVRASMIGSFFIYQLVDGSLQWRCQRYQNQKAAFCKPLDAGVFICTEI